jgi:arsenate reductase
MKVYHNPRCSKSRCVVDWLKENSFEFEIVDYMKNRLTSDEINLILKQLNMFPVDLLRKNETEFKEHILGKKLNDDEIIELMSKYSKLIERPIVVWDEKAIVARPIQKLTELLIKK